VESKWIDVEDLAHAADSVLHVISARQPDNSDHSVVPAAVSVVIASTSAMAVARVLAKGLGDVSAAVIPAVGSDPAVHAGNLARAGLAAA
jgi:hypothetical protein